MKDFHYSELSEEAKGVAVEMVHESEIDGRHVDYEYLQEYMIERAHDYGFSVGYVNWSPYPFTIDELDGFKIDDIKKVLGKKLYHLYRYVNELTEIEPDWDVKRPKKTKFDNVNYIECDVDVLIPLLERYHVKYPLPHYNTNRLRYELMSEEELYDDHSGRMEDDTIHLVNQLCENHLSPRLADAFSSFLSFCERTVREEVEFRDSSKWARDELECEISWISEKYRFDEHGNIVQKEVV